uniref:Uncharacterized protein n=1 Tax=Noctiluca scintillans TaxID=2966 RepID=A0A7S1F8V8_NOCSC
MAVEMLDVRANGALPTVGSRCSRCAPGVRGTCIFCQEASGVTYVPTHFRSESVDGDSADEGGVGSLSGMRLVGYRDSLAEHCGCAQCWLRWEARQLRVRRDMRVHCPVCHLIVDVRAGYDEVLCGACKRDVVPRGGSLMRGVAYLWAWIRRCDGCCAVYVPHIHRGVVLGVHSGRSPMAAFW